MPDEFSIFLVSFLFGFVVSIPLYLRVQLVRFRKDQEKVARIHEGTSVLICRNCVVYDSASCRKITGNLQAGDTVVVTGPVIYTASKTMVPIILQRGVIEYNLQKVTVACGVVPLTLVRVYEQPGASPKREVSSPAGRTLLQSRSIETVASEPYQHEESLKTSLAESPTSEGLTPSPIPEVEPEEIVLPPPPLVTRPAMPGGPVPALQEGAGTLSNETAIFETPRWPAAAATETPRQEQTGSCWLTGSSSVMGLCAPVMANPRPA